MAVSLISAAGEKTPLAVFIFQRLRELGINHVFGCPGDFNLNLLDYIYTVPEMKWVGTCNQLNGAYAADGYARIRGIPGALWYNRFYHPSLEFLARKHVSHSSTGEAC
jgi:hypothetical protein